MINLGLQKVDMITKTASAMNLTKQNKLELIEVDLKVEVSDCFGLSSPVKAMCCKNGKQSDNKLTDVT